MQTISQDFRSGKSDSAKVLLTTRNYYYHIFKLESSVVLYKVKKSTFKFHIFGAI